MRLFIAAEISEECRENILDLISNLRKSASFSKWRWSPPENLHITLKFLGSSPTDPVPQLLEQISALSKNTKDFLIRPERLQIFSSALVLGIPQVGFQELHSLAQQTESFCKKIGFKPEQRPYQPHITLARNKQDKGSKGLKTPPLENPKLPKLPKLKETLIEQISLFESKTLPEGSVYQRLKTFELQGH